MAERTIEANGVELCTEPFGDTAHPPILLIMGNHGVVGTTHRWTTCSARTPLRASKTQPGDVHTL